MVKAGKKGFFSSKYERRRDHYVDLFSNKIMKSKQWNDKKLEFEEELRQTGITQAKLLLSRVYSPSSHWFKTAAKDTNNSPCDIYQQYSYEKFTMKSVCTMNCSSIVQVTNFLNAHSSDIFRQMMGDVFGDLFVDGEILHDVNNSNNQDEYFSINWMAMKALSTSKTREYLFLQYGNIFEKFHSNSVEESKKGIPLLGAQVWESIQLHQLQSVTADKKILASIPTTCISQSGFTFVESSDPTSKSDGKDLTISFFISIPCTNPVDKEWRNSLPNLRKNMKKVAGCVSNLCQLLEKRNNMIDESLLLDRSEWANHSNYCFICVKSFTTLRRRHHCRLCGSLICYRCCQKKNVLPSNPSKHRAKKIEVRVCVRCAAEDRKKIRGVLNEDKPVVENSSVSLSSRGTLESTTNVSLSDSQSNSCLSFQQPVPLAEGERETSLNSSSDFFSQTINEEVHHQYNEGDNGVFFRISEMVNQYDSDSDNEVEFRDTADITGDDKYSLTSNRLFPSIVSSTIKTDTKGLLLEYLDEDSTMFSTTHQDTQVQSQPINCFKNLGCGSKVTPKCGTRFTFEEKVNNSRQSDRTSTILRKRRTTSQGSFGSFVKVDVPNRSASSSLKSSHSSVTSRSSAKNRNDLILLSTYEFNGEYSLSEIHKMKYGSRSNQDMILLE